MSEPDRKLIGLAVALHCNHGRWVGEDQFAACVPCIDQALKDTREQAERALLEQSLAHQENIRRIRVECDAANQEYEQLRTQLHAAQEALRLAPSPMTFSRETIYTDWWDGPRAEALSRRPTE